ncbi:MAG: CarD family transcriptional regulator [Oscillospiraceae bacterium]
MYEQGSYLVYGTGEICRVEGSVMKCFDGKNEREYICLAPLEAGNSTYYIPADKLGEKARALLTREEILALIDRIPQATELWIPDKNERRNHFDRVLRGGDFMQLAAMMQAIFLEREKKCSGGKHLCATDEKAFSAAERLIAKEFSFVLNITEAEVAGFIDARLEQQAQ